MKMSAAERWSLIRWMTGLIPAVMFGLACVSSLVWTTHVEAHDMPSGPSERIFLLVLLAICIAHVVSSVFHELTLNNQNDR